MYKYSFGLFVSIIILSFISCGEEPIYIPKPRTYPKVDYPERNYVQLDTNFCAFSFEYPDYMEFEQDAQFFNADSKHPCWFNLKIPDLSGNVHFTYTDISGDSLEYNLYEVYKDAYMLAEKHNIKAVANEDNTIMNPEGEVYGQLFNIEGHVASPFQFMLTDSTEHAIRASLYFDCRPDPDSMRPVIEFVKTDVVGMINSFRWKDGSTASN